MTDSFNAVTPRPPKPSKPNERWPRKFFGWFCWIYILVLLGLWCLIRWRGDRWWVATLLMFGPRWVATLPLAVLLPLAIVIRRRSIPPIFLGGIIAIFLVDGLCVPWRAAIEPAQHGTPLRVLELNAHDDAVDIARLQQFIADVHPDIVAIEECLLNTEHQAFGPGWYVARKNELVIGSRFPIRGTTDLSRASNFIWGHAMRAEVATSSGNAYVIVLHLRSPHASFRDAIHGSAKGRDEMQSNSALRKEGARILRQAADGLSGPVLLVGDFNLPAESSIYRQYFGVFGNAFDGGGWGFGWTYRVAWTDTRIDHILFNDSWTCQHAWVGPDVGSPHRPLIADLYPVNRK